MGRFTGGKSEDVGLESNCAQSREVGGPERGLLMPSENSSVLSAMFAGADDQDDFIRFLRFCADGLNKGEQVQAIWRGYLETTGCR